MKIFLPFLLILKVFHIGLIGVIIRYSLSYFRLIHFIIEEFVEVENFGFMGFKPTSIIAMEIAYLMMSFKGFKSTTIVVMEKVY